MNYDVLDISRYIISYSNKMDYGISNLKLQKVLYFVQAYFLIQTGHPCFKKFGENSQLLVAEMKTNLYGD